MSKAADRPLPTALIKGVDLLVESRFRIDAMEQILVKTNPVAYSLTLALLKIWNAKRRGSEPSANQNAQIKAHRTLAIMDCCNFAWLRSLCCRDRMSRNKKVSQATKGDDSGTWIGKVK